MLCRVVTPEHTVRLPCAAEGEAALRQLEATQPNVLPVSLLWLTTNTSVDLPTKQVRVFFGLGVPVRLMGCLLYRVQWGVVQ